MDEANPLENVEELEKICFSEGQSPVNKTNEISCVLRQQGEGNEILTNVARKLRRRLTAIIKKKAEVTEVTDLSKESWVKGNDLTLPLTGGKRKTICIRSLAPLMGERQHPPQKIQSSTTLNVYHMLDSAKKTSFGARKANELYYFRPNKTIDQYVNLKNATCLKECKSYSYLPKIRKTCQLPPCSSLSESKMSSRCVNMNCTSGSRKSVTKHANTSRRIVMSGTTVPRIYMAKAYLSIKH